MTLAANRNQPPLWDRVRLSLLPMLTTLVIARLTFREAARRKILLAALALGVAFLIVFGIGFHFIIAEVERSSSRNQLMAVTEISNFLMMAGLYVVNFLLVMMTVLTSVDTLSGEIASGTIHTLVSKPVRRWEIVLGKWLGFTVMLSLYLLLMVGGIIGVIQLDTSYTPNHLTRGVSLLWLNGVVLLSISLLGGSMLSTLANGVLVFGLYGIAFIGGWIEQIGALIPQNTAIVTTTNIGILTSLIMPSEVLWKRAAYELQSPIASAMGLISPFSSSSIPSAAMVVYAILYAAFILLLAMRQFTKRDL